MDPETGTKKDRNISKLSKLKTIISVLEGVDASEDAEEVNEESSKNSDYGRNQKSYSTTVNVFGGRA